MNIQNQDAQRRKTRVGFQGTNHSFSEAAALQLMSEIGVPSDNYVLIPLISSGNVANSLKNNQIDFGVVALSNNNGGIVEETNDIFLHDNWITVHRCVLEINQCVFVRDAQVSTSAIKKVATHSQALRQCSETLHRLFGDFEAISSDDTARSAMFLSEGAYKNDTAVVCSEAAGRRYDLHLLVKGAQDNKNNNTEFGLIKKEERSGNPTRRLSWLYLPFFTEAAFSKFVKGLAIALFLLGYPLHYVNNKFLPEVFRMSLQDSLIYMIGITASVILALYQIRKKLQLKMVTGYWIYSDRIIKALESQQLHHAILRAVVIDDVGGALRVRGWLTKSSPEQYFHSTAVFHSNLFASQGSFIYKYSHYLGDNNSLNGMVELEWSKTNQMDFIATMTGRYFGFQKRSIGSLHFRRITKERFLELCPIVL